MRYALALVSLRLNLRGSGSVLEALQVGVVIIQDLSVTLLRRGLLAGGPSADPCQARRPLRILGSLAVEGCCSLRILLDIVHRHLLLEELLH